MDTNKILKAGEIAKEIKVFARDFIKKGTPLLEIAERIETKIIALGGRPAFPVNLSIDNIAAHYTPSYNDETKAHGLLKVDFGVHVDGWVADTAFSLDLDDSEENKQLIDAAEKALEKASKSLEPKIHANKIGKVIEEMIESYGFSPVINLSGHEIKQYELHAGVTVPNVDDGREVKLETGIYAIEPFATNGLGRVHDGKPSGIYELSSGKNVRGVLAREVLSYITDEYNTLPFCSRWIVKKFGAKALFALKELEDNGNLHQFAQLVEAPHSKVSQAENTFLVEKEKVTVTTE